MFDVLVDPEPLHPALGQPMSWNDTTPHPISCTSDGCTNTFMRSGEDRYRSRPVPDGWVGVSVGWRCPEHHDYEIDFETAIEEVGAAWGARDSEFIVGRHEQEASDLDFEAVIRALKRGPLSPDALPIEGETK